MLFTVLHLTSNVAAEDMDFERCHKKDIKHDI